MSNELILKIDNPIKLAVAKEMIAETNGELFGVSFITKTDKSVRNMVCRLGVKKGVNLSSNPNDRVMQDLANNVLTVYDFNADWKANNDKGAFRRINMDGLRRIRIDGVEFTVIKEVQRELWL